jgi:hypothetical protein
LYARTTQAKRPRGQKLANRNPSLLAQRQNELAAITNLLNSMSPEEKQAQATINNFQALRQMLDQ